MESFGSRLKKLRKRLKLSQTEVANELAIMFPGMRISQGALSNLEIRKTAPRGEIVHRLCAYYNVPITYFFEESSDNADEITLYINALRLYNHDSHYRFKYSLKNNSNFSPPNLPIDEYMDI